MTYCGAAGAMPEAWAPLGGSTEAEGWRDPAEAEAPLARTWFMALFSVSRA